MDARGLPDSVLIRRALAGDQGAYSHIMDRYRGPIFRMVHHMVRNRQQAEDLVQETFIKAFAALANFNEDYAFSTWLYKIAINNCIDYFRKKKLATFSLEQPIQARDGEIAREFPDLGSSPDRTLLAKERTALIEEAIASLPERYRICIILRHQEDRSYEEIAQILHVPLGTVKARIFRAREMLKKRLKDLMRP
ncbi:MAG: sigma-70 family RNA polymerase sigma factor [candidate division KSB1 bacterium]|nr:sigma-70 family RNA polymerase sigma factor [candidate division KSB1 bacterium]